MGCFFYSRKPGLIYMVLFWLNGPFLSGKLVLLLLYLIYQSKQIADVTWLNISISCFILPSLNGFIYSEHT